MYYNSLKVNGDLLDEFDYLYPKIPKIRVMYVGTHSKNTNFFKLIVHTPKMCMVRVPSPKNIINVLTEGEW